ncbi:MAG: DUF177 domain-containing protein [Thermodesulfovibrionales bacterium]|jgi:uncharacterized protein
MKITVSEIPEEGLEIEEQEEIGFEAIDLVSPISLSLSVRKAEKEVFLHGSIRGDVRLQCSRCLQGFTMTIESPVDVVYRPTEEIAQEEAHQLRDDELETGFYREDTLDTDEVAREQLLLNIPMKPLCSAECKGICPQCGTDLNLSQCNCSVSEIDPRLAVLKQLLKKKE